MCKNWLKCKINHLKLEEHQRNVKRLHGWAEMGCMDGQKLYTKLWVVKLTLNSYYIYSPENAITSIMLTSFQCCCFCLALSWTSSSVQAPSTNKPASDEHTYQHTPHEWVVLFIVINKWLKWMRWIELDKEYSSLSQVSHSSMVEPFWTRNQKVLGSTPVWNTPSRLFHWLKKYLSRACSLLWSGFIVIRVLLYSIT